MTAETAPEHPAPEHPAPEHPEPGRRGPGRRTLLTGAALAGAVAAGGAAAAHLATRAPAALEGVRIPELAAEDLTRFGFTIRGPVLDAMEPFEEDLRVVRDLGLGSVRFSLPIHESAADWGVRGGAVVGPVVLDEAWTGVIVSALDAAAEHGLAVCAMGIGVYPHEDLPDALLPQVMASYWGALAAAVAPRTPQWQILNEPDGSDFRTYEMLDPLARPDYVDRLAALLGAVREAIHAVMPGSEVTTNLYGFPVDAAILERWTTLLDVLAPHLDAITVDAYPETGSSALVHLVEYLDVLAERYGKPVHVGEIGVKTCAACSTVAEQTGAYARYLRSLTASRARSVHFYTLRDQEDDTERFGVLDAEGRERPAFRLLQETAEETSRAADG